ncbi:hypothetical protein HPB52_025679 [Rhipicephalus sanguineus]|uniref:Uncharacterized protein n=1 Tax=Rhipicephalus sanguineus TaxID=34632 RepID=A0A9D4TE91_RHISA|nr:hypothetical protein HPB52_025679 [Rhipicephalus sanguineus]
MMKQWFDIRDTVYSGSENKTPISEENDPRMAAVETIKFLLGQGIKYVLTRNFNSDPVEALIGRLRSMCGGNDVFDARAVTIALDNIVKEKAIHPRQEDSQNLLPDQTTYSESMNTFINDHHG